MFQHKMKVWMGALILVLLAAACAPAAPAQDDRLGNLETKVDLLTQMQVDLTSLRFRVRSTIGR